MSGNEAVQWSIVGLIVLAALVWITVKAIQMGRRKGDGNTCSCCSDATDCKARELKEMANSRRRPENCRDGQSARN